MIYVVFICYSINHWYISKHIYRGITEENVLRVNEFAYDGVQKLGQSLVNIKNGAVTGHGFSRMFE